jgi:excisionase family DNA binding protein
MMVLKVAMEEEKRITVAEAARELGVIDRRVRALIDGGFGRLPAVKVGRDWMILPSDLEKVRERKAGRPRKLKRGRKAVED